MSRSRDGQSYIYAVLVIGTEAAIGDVIKVKIFFENSTKFAGEHLWQSLK